MHSSLYSTMNVINQIEDLSLQVNVAFVGDKLLETIQYLETSPEIQNGSRSYLVFHYTPSLVTSRFNFTSIKFEPCDHGWESPIFTPNLTLTSPNCLYNLNRLAKVSSKADHFVFISKGLSWLFLFSVKVSRNDLYISTTAITLQV